MYEGSLDDYDKIAEYINKELDLGRTQGEIEVNDFNVKVKVMAKRLSRRGFKKVGGRWVNSTDTIPVAPSSNKNTVIQSTSHVIVNNDDNSSSNVNVGVSLTSDQNKSLVNIIDKYDDLDFLLSNIDNIKLMLNTFNEQYAKGYVSTDDKNSWGIKIELPIEGDKNFRTTVRVNDVVWKQFDEFCSKHSEFTKRDLISMALREYINNHSGDDC